MQPLSAFARTIFNPPSLPAPPDRRVCAEELAALEASRVKVNAEHTSVVTANQKLVAEATEKLRQLDQRLSASIQARHTALAAIDVRVRHLRRELITSADRRIDEVRKQIDVRLEERRSKLSRTEEFRTPVLGNEGRRVTVRSNDGAIRRLLDAIHDARAALDALKLQHHDDLNAPIAAILASVDAAWNTIDDIDPPLPTK